MFFSTFNMLRNLPPNKFTINYQRCLSTREQLNPKYFYDTLSKEGVQLFVGVPDSLLKDFNSYVASADPNRVIVTANEGNAIGMAVGHYLSTGNIPVVYLQNSGLGNAVNPLMSLTHSDVYGIPMLLLIGWRGEPGISDEPQHRAQGRSTPSMCSAMELLYSILPSDKDGANSVVKMAFKHMKHMSSPYALLVRKDTFSKFDFISQTNEKSYPLGREEALRIILSHLQAKDIVVGSTGYLSREIYTLRDQIEKSHSKDFLSVGSMGHSSSIALGIALEKPNRQVFNIEGDGSFIMHMGATVTIGTKKPKNFKQIIMNNGVHDSVGGQPTDAFNIDMGAIAKACGYRSIFYAETAKEIEDSIIALRKAEGPAILEIRVHPGARKELGRPTSSFHSQKKEFMNNLQEE